MMVFLSIEVKSKSWKEVNCTILHISETNLLRWFQRRKIFFFIFLRL